MTYDNSGTLGRNDRATSDKHPSHKGKATIGGIEYWISAWVKEANGHKFFSLAFEPKNKPQDAPSYDNESEDIPF